MMNIIICSSHLQLAGSKYPTEIVPCCHMLFAMLSFAVCHIVICCLPYAVYHISICCLPYCSNENMLQCPPATGRFQLPEKFVRNVQLNFGPQHPAAHGVLRYNNHLDQATLNWIKTQASAATGRRDSDQGRPPHWSPAQRH